MIKWKKPSVLFQGSNLLYYFFIKNLFSNYKSPSGRHQNLLFKNVVVSKSSAFAGEVWIRLKHHISQLTVWIDANCKFDLVITSHSISRHVLQIPFKLQKDEIQIFKGRVNRIILGSIVFVFFEANYFLFFIFGFCQWNIWKAFGLGFS